MELIRLEDLYRKKFLKNIEDKVINGVHVNNNYIFPRNWNYISSLEKKINMLNKAIDNDILLGDLPKMQYIDLFANSYDKVLK